MKYADLIIKNGNVVTVNKNNDIVEAVAVKNNKIFAVGTDKELLKLAKKDTEIIDAEGKTVTPGLIESHMHFLMYGLLDDSVVNIMHPKVESIEEIKDIVRDEVRRKEAGEWIKLQGYDHKKLKENRHPTVEDFDEVAPDNPVQCSRVCAHMGVYNTKALEIGAIKRENQYAEGEVVIDEDGKLTGLLKETAHMEMSKNVVVTDEEYLRGLKNANDIVLKNGITSVHDAGAYGKDSYRMMQYAVNNGQVKIRLRPMVFDMFGKDSNEELINSYIETGIYTGMGNENFQIGPAKIMIDGSSSGPSSAVLEGYTHEPGSYGILVWNQEEANEILGKAHKAGYQITAHAIGDKAVTIVVNAIENALKETPRDDHRHRIEHAGITNPKLIDKIAELNIIPIANPAFISINGQDYNTYYGERVNYMFPLRSYLDKGIINTIASDAPVTNPNPMYSFYGALARKDYNNQVETGINQRVDMEDAIRMITYNGAYASFEEKIKGSLELGKLADITIFSENLFRQPVEDLFDVHVDYTILDGKIEYKR